MIGCRDRLHVRPDSIAAPADQRFLHRNQRRRRTAAQTLAALASGSERAAPLRISRPSICRPMSARSTALDDVRLTGALAAFDCRNNRLAETGAAPGRLRGGGGAARASATAPHRVGVFLGTSTSGILQTELAYRRARPGDRRAAAGLRLPRHAQHLFARRFRAAQRSACAGPAVVVSSRLLVERQGVRAAPRA